MDAANGWFEIFGIDIDRGIYDAEVFKELLQAALSDAKHRKGNVMTFFCDEEYEKVAKECGLECIGNYLCYKTHLNWQLPAYRDTCWQENSEEKSDFRKKYPRKLG